MLHARFEDIAWSCKRIVILRLCILERTYFDSRSKVDMKSKYNLGNFYMLWATQSLSQLGSTMTGFALTLWLYQRTGSALQTALLSICSYAPYVIMSMFAGALSDRWNKKRTMLVCDALAALCTCTVFLLLKLNLMLPWHMYVLNAVSGLMNTVQNPASEVAYTLITPKAQYQRTSSLKSFSSSLITILHPMLATALFGFGGMDAVIAVDLVTFAIAFAVLAVWIRIPDAGAAAGTECSSVLELVRGGLGCLRSRPLVLKLIFFLAGVNFVASAFDATLPAFVLPDPRGGEAVLGLVTTFAGIAMLLGSLISAALPTPRDRVRLICFTMLFSLTTDNFLMSLTDSPIAWCAGQVLGYLPVPLMNASLDVIVRSSIPAQMQGRVYACRNALQFFTIPIGTFFGGWMVDMVCEPYMARAAIDGLAVRLFGLGKGSGAAMMIFLMGIMGGAICLIFTWLLRKHRFEEPR